MTAIIFCFFKSDRRAVLFPAFSGWTYQQCFRYSLAGTFKDHGLAGSLDPEAIFTADAWHRETAGPSVFDRAYSGMGSGHILCGAGFVLRDPAKKARSTDQKIPVGSPERAKTTRVDKASYSFLHHPRFGSVSDLDKSDAQDVSRGFSGCGAGRRHLHFNI